MKRLSVFLLCIATSWGRAQTTNPPPNIVLVLADDLGWTDAGFAGSRFYETPRLDALAAGGIRFTSFYASPNGAPTRAALFTGEYSPRTGVYATDSLERGDAAARRLVPPPNAGHLPAGMPTLATVLKAGGYTTAFFGKWELGRGPEERPDTFGFDEVLLSQDKHLGFTTDPPVEVPANAYLADFLTDRALDFMGRHTHQPFFVTLAHFAVHAPYEAKPEWVAHFEKRAPAGGHRDAVYAAMIAMLDQDVGRILDKLDEWRLSDRTVVIFLSDNGGVGGYIDTENNGRRTGVTDNSPLRGGKGMLYEGGIRVPFLARWPGVIQPGSRTTQPALDIDLFPTLCDISGLRPPTNHVLDGVSLAPLLRDPNAHLGRDAIYWHFPGYVEAQGKAGWRTTPAGAVRAGNFKLIEWFEDGRTELFNLIEDLGENNSLVRSLPEKATELKGKLAAWRTAVHALMPQPKAATPDAAAAPKPPP